MGATSSGGEVGGVATPSGGLAGEPPASPRLFVVLPKVVSQDALRQIFSKFPGMERCDLKLDRASGRSKGFAYVTFTSELQAEAAIRELMPSFGYDGKNTRQDLHELLKTARDERNNHRVELQQWIAEEERRARRDPLHWLRQLLGLVKAQLWNTLTYAASRARTPPAGWR